MNTNKDWKLVPVIATDDMEAAAEDDYEQTGATFPRWKSAYAAMLNAAPPAPTSHPIPTGATGEVQDNSGMSPYCPECDGGGRISVLSDNSPDAHDVDIDCTHCGGSGSAADAAKSLARALQSERMQHLQIYGEYKNFHRSLCARFGYGHDPVHFRRDLVSLEEAIASKASAPAAGDALALPELNADLIDILGRPSFACIQAARMLRVCGVDIPSKAEAEQATVIHYLLGLYLKHESKWAEIANEDLKQRHAAALAAQFPQQGEE